MRRLFFTLAPLALLVASPLVVAACSSTTTSSTPGADASTGGDDGGGDAATVADPYQVTLLDNARIVSDSMKPNFQKATGDVPVLHDAPFANVKLVVDLSSTCFPFDGWLNDRPPSGQNWPADCDAFDRNFEMLLSDPASPAMTPRIEMVRAITPFGGPMHVEQDVTDMFNAITGPRTFEVDIPTYSDGAGKVSGSAGGWNVSAHLEVTPGDAPAKVLAVIPIADTSLQPAMMGMAQAASFTLPAGTTHGKIEYRVTGHGGATDNSPTCIGPADEFCKRNHTITIDGAPLDSLQPWRMDCTKNCTNTHNTALFGPSTYCKQNPCGDPGSVVAPRANWCPGTVTAPFSWTPDPLKSAGMHSFGYAVDTIAGQWRVTATVYAYGD